MTNVFRSLSVFKSPFGTTEWRDRLRRVANDNFPIQNANTPLGLNAVFEEAPDSNSEFSATIGGVCNDAFVFTTKRLSG